MKEIKNKAKATLLVGALLLGGLTLARPLLGAGPSQPVNPPCDAFARTFVFTLFQFTSATTAIDATMVTSHQLHASGPAAPPFRGDSALL